LRIGERHLRHHDVSLCLLLDKPSPVQQNAVVDTRRDSMTASQRTVSGPTALQRRIAWFAIAMAALSLVVTAADLVSGGHVRWTAWALPFLIVANASVFFLGALGQRPRAVRVFLFLSLGLAVAIILAEAYALVRR
jgi:hypothetical protein